MMEIRRSFFNLVDSALRQCIKPEFYQIEKSWFCVHVPERIVGFHMTSLKFKIQNCRSYRDFYFHDILEQPKLNFHTCIFSLKKRSWFCDALRLNSDKLWRDAAFIWQPREQSCRLKTLLSLQCTKFNPLQGQLVKFFICVEFLDTKLSEKSNFQTTDGVQ